MLTGTMMLYFLAFVFFMLAGLGVNRPPLSWRDLGFATLVAALLLPGLIQ